MYKNLVERIHAESQQLQNNIAKNTLKEPLHELRKKDIAAQKEKFIRDQEAARKHYDKFTELEKKIATINKKAETNYEVPPPQNKPNIIHMRRGVRSKDDMDLELKKQIEKQEKRNRKYEHRLIHHQKSRWGEEERKKLFETRFKMLEEWDRQQERLKQRQQREEEAREAQAIRDAIDAEVPQSV
jgi:hypothetical protein